MLSTHWMNESEPFERNCASSLKSRTSIAALGGRLADQVRAADLARAHDLQVIDEEDGDPARVEDVVDLGLARARLRGREAARADRPDAVGLVEDRDIELVGDGRGVAEVLEQRAGPTADDLAQVLGERLGAGQVERVQAALGELGDEVERDDRLAGARAALDEEDDLLLVLAGAADGVEDRVVGDELLVEERERRLVADDAGDVVEQALVRLERGRGDAIEDDAALVGSGDALVEERRERIELVAGEGRVAWPGGR